MQNQGPGSVIIDKRTNDSGAEYPLTETEDEQQYRSRAGTDAGRQGEQREFPELG